MFDFIVVTVSSVRKATALFGFGLKSSATAFA
jgi:hypothetical protein